MVQPLTGMEPDGEDHGPDAPVCEHADPNRDGTEATEAA